MVEIPTNICRFGSHECFAYRVLAKEFRDLVEVFDSVTDLCGTKDLRCPSSLSPSLGPDPSSLSPSLSPDPVFTPLPSGSLQTDKMISMGDYVADDDLEAVLAALLEQTNPVGIYNQSPAIHPLITKPQTQPKANKRSRAASHNTGREVVSFSPSLLPFVGSPGRRTGRGSAHRNCHRGCKAFEENSQGNLETVRYNYRTRADY
jgi:hypothetical protein